MFEKSYFPNPFRRNHRIVIELFVLIVIIFFYGDLISRTIRFSLVGNVVIDGFTVFLQSDDNAITPVILKYGAWDPEIGNTIRGLLKPGDTVIDVGANIGWFTLMASRAVGKDGRVIAFEPEPMSFDFLRKNVEENKLTNVILEQKALSKTRGTLRLFIDDANKGAHSFTNSESRTHSVEVETLSLDDYLKNFKENITLIKIDTEGAEGLILEGMQGLLRTQYEMNIIMEFHPRLLRQMGTDPAAMLIQLQELHYVPYEIDYYSGKLIQLDRKRLSDLVELLDRSGCLTNILLTRGDVRYMPVMAAK